jgi:PAS domain S-box-containing protein
MRSALKKSIPVETRIILLLFSLTILPAVVVSWLAHEQFFGNIRLPRYASAEWFDKDMFVVLAICASLSFLSVLLLVARIGKPVTRLVKVARAIARENGAAAADGKGHFGIAELTSALEAISDQLHSTRKPLPRNDAESDERGLLLRRIIDSDPNLIFIKDAEGRFLFANQAMAKTYGMSPNEMIGKRNSDLVFLPQDAVAYDQTNQQVLETCQEQATIETAVLGDGKVHYFHTLRKPLIWKDGSWTVLTIAMDVTELKQAEQDLLATQNDLNGMLDAIPDLLFEVGLDGRYYSYRSPRTDLLAAPPEVLLGKLISEILPAQASTICMAALQEAEAHGYSFGRQFELPLGNEIKWFELSVARKPALHDGEPRFVVISRDITRRKVAEQHMLTLYTAMNQSPLSVIITDPEARIQYINPYFEKISGYRADEVLGRNPRIFKSEQTPKEVYAEMWDRISSGQVWHGELVNRNKDGQHYSEETHIAPVLDDTGRISQYVCIKIDNSERKQAERRLAESYHELQKLSSHLENLREDERARFARDLHDDMGALLVALKMRVSWLTSRLPAERPDLANEARHIAALVADAIGTIHQIVNELRPNLQDGFGFCATIDDYVKKFERNARIRCKLVLPDEEPLLDASRRVTLFRILQESLNNVALHAKATGARICLEAQKQTLQLDIEDDGIGFDVGAPRKRGIGLLGIRERAIMIGGMACVESTPGKGTRVAVTVPLSGDCPQK